ncbi:GntR family transcriptional regulator [Rhodosalinus halophilus]|uniref:GntR family transcriptional regulator n=1 Tax=Rhodosalinus halophilus TaxID=2259333 RepID=A0A365U770_9RHOB|nr:GntR family transcriptional regulator [Rhodosalinus halophilus]RBI83354.1 GntR family transcriptional regulator [Rhodosalinus halophilus]
MSASFREIKADVRARIARGDWAPGALLPTEADLARAYACARATVNRALRELAEEGLLERKRKSGTRVRRAPVRQARFDIPLVRREIEDQGAAYRYALVRRAEIAAPDWLRARMGLAAAAPVLHLVAMHYANGAPYQHEERWISLDTLPQARRADFTRVGPNEWLVATIPFTDAELSFTATAATEALAAHLGCPPGDALFRMERSTWFEGQPVTYVRMTFPPGHRMTTRY